MGTRHVSERHWRGRGGAQPVQHATQGMNRREPVWVCLTCKRWHADKPDRGCRGCQGAVAFMASKAEARRHASLVLLQEHGQIRDLELQPTFEIAVQAPTGVRVVVRRYRADFRYLDNKTGRRIVEDVKGHDTDLSKFKRELVEAAYGVTITLVRNA